MKKNHKTMQKDNKLAPDTQVIERNLEVIRTIVTVILVLPGTAEMRGMPTAQAAEQQQASFCHT